ncbi:hypothetical protein ABGT15_03425 [Flavobacterium enshiense]|uniref:hypothetical protein n=1 Tax=Flavobacterium enshiense TaxID=1341165 RepID=UPI00345C84EC
MKKLALLGLLFLFQIGYSQQQDSTEVVSPITLKKNEVRLDIVSLIAKTRFHVSYERFLNKDFSVGLSASLAKSKKAKDDFEENFNSTLPEYEINPFVRYSLSKSQKTYYFVEAFMSVNGGKYKELKHEPSILGSNKVIVTDDNYTDLAIGGAVGYKLYFSDKFTVELFVGVAKNILNTDVSPTYVQRVGANFGYRF